MNIFLIALIPPFLFAISNFVDKYIITRYFKHGGIGTLMIFSSITAIVVLPVIYIIHPDVFHISDKEKIVIMISGIFSLLGVLAYLHALNQEDTSSVVPLFQLMPVLTLGLGVVFLHEVLHLNQVLGGLLIIGGSIVLSIDLSKKVRFKTNVFWLMFLSSLLFSMSGILFKLVALSTDYWTTAFWSYIGFLLTSVFFYVFFTKWRREFNHSIRMSGKHIVALNIFNEVINAVGAFVMAYATLFAPIAIIYFINSVQSVFALVLGIILTLACPRIFQEKIEKKYVFHKLLAIAVMIVGVVYMY